MSRKLPNLIGAFLEWTDGLPSPKIFRLWAGIAAVSAALQRRVFTQIVGKKQYGNLYILMVSPPGIGKTVAITAAREIVLRVQTIVLSPERITRRAFYQHLQDANQIMGSGMHGEDMDVHHSLSAFIDEFGVFVRRNDYDFMVELTALYDNPHWFEYQTHTAGENKAANCCFGFISGTTLRGVRDTFTNEILDQGFPARIILLFSNEIIKPPLFQTDERKSLEQMSMFDALVHDLEAVSHLTFEYTWTSDAQAYLEEWAAKDLRPYPLDPRFEHYNIRRLAHVTKLTMIMAASRRDDSVLQLEDVVTAREVLLEAEQVMPNAISAMGANPFYMQMRVAATVVKKEFHDRGDRAVPQHIVTRILSREVPPQYMTAVLEAIVQNKWVYRQGEAGKYTYLPGDKDA